jgi:hypothetical protein
MLDIYESEDAPVGDVAVPTVGRNDSGPLDNGRADLVVAAHAHRGVVFDDGTSGGYVWITGPSLAET